MEQTGQRFISVLYFQFIQWSRLVRDLSVYCTSSSYSGADWSEIYQCTVLPVHTVEQTGQRLISVLYFQFIQWSRLVRDLSVYCTSSSYSGADWSEIYQCTVLPVHTLEQTGQRFINLDYLQFIQWSRLVRDLSVYCTSSSYSGADWSEIY